jgi:hypothetical protein
MYLSSLTRISSKQKQSILLFSAIAGAVLILFSWWQSYPLYLRSADSDIFFSVNPLYWVGLALTVPSLLILSRIGNRTHTALSAVLIFLSLRSLSFFYYFVPGPDQFFQPLAAYYVSDGHTVAIFQPLYAWPAFFILAREVELVTGLSSRIYAHLFVLLMGILIVMTVILVAERESVSSGAAVFGFGVLSFYFLNYQFAPQVLAFPLLLVLIAIDFRLRPSRGLSVLKLLIFVSVCFTHAFIPMFYLLFRVALRIWRRTESKLMTLALAVIYLTVLIYFTVSLKTMTETLVTSAIKLLGVREYSGVYYGTVAPREDTLIQFFSRATIVLMSSLSVLGLIQMIRKKQLSSEDYALAAAGGVYLISGVGFSILGARALQLLSITGSIPIGFFGAMRRRIPVILLIVLAVVGVSLPMHASYANYTYQDPFTAGQASFVASHFGSRGAATVRVFMEEYTSWNLEVPLMSAGSTYYLVTEFRGRPLPSYDYYEVTPSLVHNVRAGFSNVTVTLSTPYGYNRVVDDARSWWLVYVDY